MASRSKASMQKHAEAAAGRGRDRFVIERTYTSYAIQIPADEYEALGNEGRKAVKDRLDALMPHFDYVEFDGMPGEGPHLYFRIPFENESDALHESIQDILDEEVAKAMDAAPAAPGRR